MGARKKQLFHDTHAESEADRIGARFMDSADVVSDMSRAFGHDFSGVNIHADSIGSSRVSGTGVDAIAEGNDIYFGSGVYQKGEPASNGLLAHELAHTMQQTGGGAGVEVSSPMGAAQGGIKDWFRKLFGGEDFSKATVSQPRFEGGAPSLAPSSDRFMDEKSRTLNTMLSRGSRAQLQDPAVRNMVLEDYNRNTNKRLINAQNQGIDAARMDQQVFGGGHGEMDSLNMIINAALPEDFAANAADAGISAGKGVTASDASLDYIGNEVEKNQDLMNILQGTSKSFQGVDNYADADARSNRTMLNLVKHSLEGAAGRSRLGAEKAGDTAGAAQWKKRQAHSKGVTQQAGLGNSPSAMRFRRLLARLMQ